MSPESLIAAAVCIAALGCYYCFMWQNKRSNELLDRISWEHLLKSDAESPGFHQEIEKEQRVRIGEEQKKRKYALLHELHEAVEKEQKGRISTARASLEAMDWTTEALDDKEREIRKHQSEERGVSLKYLLSQEFQELACNASESNDPSFNDLKWPFFLGPLAIGRDKMCPRDGKKGCALVDTLPVDMRAKCTHFLSWAWAYKLSTVRDSLHEWVVTTKCEASEVSFAMCFFTNNQYRILVPGANCKGSDNLEFTLEANLKRTGKMVAILDTFDKPTYLTRAWTIYEQFTAKRLGIEVIVTLPSESNTALLNEFDKGKEAIKQVRNSMVSVDSSMSRASDPVDENRIKTIIQESFGFREVDHAIRKVMTSWVAAALCKRTDEIVHGEHTNSVKDCPGEGCTDGFLGCKRLAGRSGK